MIYRTKDLEEKQAKRLVDCIFVFLCSGDCSNVVSSTTTDQFCFFASSVGFGMRRGYLRSFTSHAITSCLLSNLSTWKWLLSWQG